MAEARLLVWPAPVQTNSGHKSIGRLYVSRAATCQRSALFIPITGNTRISSNRPIRDANFSLSLSFSSPVPYLAAWLGHPERPEWPEWRLQQGILLPVRFFSIRCGCVQRKHGPNLIDFRVLAEPDRQTSKASTRVLVTLPIVPGSLWATCTTGPPMLLGAGFAAIMGTYKHNWTKRDHEGPGQTWLALMRAQFAASSWPVLIPLRLINVSQLQSQLNLSERGAKRKRELSVAGQCKSVCVRLQGENERWGSRATYRLEETSSPPRQASSGRHSRPLASPTHSTTKVLYAINSGPPSTWPLSKYLPAPVVSPLANLAAELIIPRA